VFVLSVCLSVRWGGVSGGSKEHVLDRGSDPTRERGVAHNLTHAAAASRPRSKLLWDFLLSVAVVAFHTHVYILINVKKL